MITDRIKSWQASRLGRMSLRCMVKHNGEPLQGADVKFVPEPFLGPYMKTASGVTDQNGVAMLSIPPDLGAARRASRRASIAWKSPNRTSRSGPPSRPSLPRTASRRTPRAGPVSQAGLDIPAKYNTETILGQEVAIDAEGVRNGITFDLIF